MKKTDVLAEVSATRRSCERANARLRDTANVFDVDLMITRPTTTEEKQEALIEAWLWAQHASIQAQKAQRLVLKYAMENGVTIEEINRWELRDDAV